MSKMIERVAKAIEPSAWDCGGNPEAQASRRAWATRKARLAVAAMFEPTDAMVVYPERDIPVWKTMIDKALQ
jgi:hypothetical protein